MPKQPRFGSSNEFTVAKIWKGELALRMEETLRQRVIGYGMSGRCVKQAYRTFTGWIVGS